MEGISFSEALGRVKSVQLGWNGALEYTEEAMSSSLVSLYYKLVRDLNDEYVFEKTLELLSSTSNPKVWVDVIVLAFQTRATRMIGKGERKLFYDMFHAISFFFEKVVMGKETCFELLKLIPYYGYYKDFLYLIKHEKCLMYIKTYIIDILAFDCMSDYTSLQINKKTETMVGKYMPREKSQFEDIAFELAEKMFTGTKKGHKMKKYRKVISYLNTQGLKTTTEVFMCSQNYSKIDFGKVSSLCMNRNRKAFLNLPLKGDGYRSYTIDRIEASENLKKTEKIKGSELFPYSIVKSCIKNTSISKEEIDVLNKQWTSLREKLSNDEGEFVQVKNTLVMVDVSPSMTGLPMEVAISLGILFSELCENEFKDVVLTFDEDSQFVDLKGLDCIHKKTNVLYKSSWGASTNIMNAMKKILQIAKKFKVEKLPDLMIVSDMQFDMAHKKKTTYNVFKDLFHEEGINTIGKPWDVPKIIFWNVSSQTTGSPLVGNEENTVLLSGFSPSIFKSIFGNLKAGQTPEEVVREILEDTNFDKIRHTLSSMCYGPFIHYNNA